MANGTFGALKKEYGTSETLTSKGVWIPVHVKGLKEDQCPSFLVSRMARGNRKYLAALEAMSRKNKRRIDRGLMTSSEGALMLLKIFCDTVLLGWRNIFDVDGKPIAFDNKLAYKELSDPAMEDVASYLMEEAQELARFQEDEAEEIAEE